MIRIISIIILVVGATYFLVNNKSYPIKMEKINFPTSDNQSIAANLFSVNEPLGWLILVHMMPTTKESWNAFAEQMQKSGYESLAIDLRGHGESSGGPDGFNNFSDAQHQASIGDLEAAWGFLKARGATAEKTNVIGGSIGANLSLQFLVNHPEVSGGVLLSAGNYRGLDSAALVGKLSPSQNIIFAASKLDGRSTENNGEQNKQYFDLARQVINRHLILFDGMGHGTSLFDLKSEYNLEEAIKKFLQNGRID